MERNKEYFMRKIQEGGYKVDQIFDIKDIEEVMALIIHDHDRAGCSLSEKNDYGTLREVLKSFIPANEARRGNEGMVITTATQAITAIDPKLIKDLDKKSLVEFSANINEKFLEAENLGSVAMSSVLTQISNVAEKSRNARGVYTPDEEKFDAELFKECPAGRAIDFFARTFARKLAERMS